MVARSVHDAHAATRHTSLAGVPPRLTLVMAAAAVGVGDDFGEVVERLVGPENLHPSPGLTCQYSP
ncbi:MAG: hypothetical protein IPJ52_07420 [Rhodocyclaceae bacterium]|nr:hypothetical protein [Rhodocyclaceae bacterium]MBK7814136.1 hypothetical protein [Rhodocyclaceae bacterium]